MFYLKRLLLRCYGPLSFEGEAELKSGVNLLIGKNGSGKTLTLRMLDDAANGRSPENFSQYAQQVSEDIQVKLMFKAGAGEDDIETVTFLKTGSWQNPQFLSNRIRVITSERSVRGELRTPNVFRQVTDFSVPVPGTEINISDEFNKAIIFELLQRIKDLQESVPNITKEIEEDYRRGLVDFEKDIKVDFEKDNPVYFVDFKGREVPITKLSDGEKEYLYFYSFLRRIRSDEGKIILIDEPELHLHSSQLKKLCELISSLGQKNQVIIATHSGEILQSFIDSNIILLNKGQLTNIKSNDDLKKALDEMGLPIDPSVFTAHWICAENDPNVPLKGTHGPKTPIVLEWLFGRDISKRFWSFKQNWERAESIVTGISKVASDEIPIKLSVILDGDKNIVSEDLYPPAPGSQTPSHNVIHYWPFWEIENIFLCPAILNATINNAAGKNGFDQFWEKVVENKEKYFQSIFRTILKNSLKKYTPDKTIKRNPEDDLAKLKGAISGYSFNKDLLRQKFEQIISDKNWCWIPGKETLPLVLQIKSDFWETVCELVKSEKFGNLLRSETIISNILNEVAEI